MQYRSEIDGLRALAIVPVVLFHAGFGVVSGGYVGVDVFFVISGYLITTLIYQDVKEGRFSAVRFYERRIKRLFPALFLVAVVSTAIAWQLYLPYDLENYFGNLASVFNFTSNIHFYIHSGYFDPSSELNPLLHTWSLTVEEQFYFIFPWLLILFWKGGKSLLWSGVILLALVSFLLAEWRLDHKPMAAFYLLYARGWELLIGSVCALLLVDTKIQKNVPAPVAELLSWSGLLMILYAIIFYSGATPVAGRYTAIPVLGTALIILFATQNVSLVRLLSMRLFVSLGLISYSTYLWHQPMLAFYRYIYGEEIHVLAAAALAMASFVVGYYSWKFVEKPFRYGNWFWHNRRQVFSRAGFALAVLFLTGIIGEEQKGFPHRLDESVRSIYETQPRRLQVETCMLTEESIFASECLSNPDGLKHVLIVGDSHAGSLYSGLNEAFSAQGWKLSMLAYARCVPFISEQKLAPFKQHNQFLSKHINSRCDAVKTSFREQISSADFDKVIVLNHLNNWVGSYKKRSFDGFLAMYADELEALFDKNKLIVMGPLPVWLDDLPKLIVADYVSGSDYLGASQKGLYMDNGYVNDLLHMEFEKRGIEYMPSLPAFCDQTGCQRTARNSDGIMEALSYDGAHLSFVGSEKLSHYIISTRFEKSIAAD